MSPIVVLIYFISLRTAASNMATSNRSSTTIGLGMEQRTAKAPAHTCCSCCVRSRERDKVTTCMRTMATSIPVIASKGNLGFFCNHSRMYWKLRLFRNILYSSSINIYWIFLLLKVLSWKYRQQLLLHIARLGLLRTYVPIYRNCNIGMKKVGKKLKKLATFCSILQLINPIFLYI